jgi:hypothetical protein
MARYIDADKLLEQVNSLEQLARKRVCDTPTNSPAYERYATQFQEREKMLAILKAQPTADVVPKSEVEEIIEETFKIIRKNFVISPLCKSALSDLEAELKKKYTESNNEQG